MTIQFVYPELCLFIFAMILLISGFTQGIKKFNAFIALLGVATSLLLLPQAAACSTAAFFKLLHADWISYFFRAMVLLSTAFIIYLSIPDTDIQQEDRGEYYFFLLFLAISLMLAVSSRNLMMIYIAVEAVSIISYVLVGYIKKSILSSEASMKYFLFGALSTGVMLYGVSMVYGLFGSLDLSCISAQIKAGHVPSTALLLSGMFILVGLAFKCSLAPFHMAAPDAYHAAPTPVSAFLSIGPKAMGFALLLRIFLDSGACLIVHWVLLAKVLAVLSMVLGNFIALKQTNVKRMLAYSSIAHAGFMLMALTVPGSMGIRALAIYLAIYMFMNLGVFGCVAITKREEIDQFAGLSRQNPLVALIMAVGMLSLAGLPPLSGFMAKFLILAVIIKAKFYKLAVIALLNSVVALFYYLKVVKAMYLSKNDYILPINQSSSLIVILILTLLANLFLGLWPSSILQIISF